MGLLTEDMRPHPRWREGPAQAVRLRRGAKGAARKRRRPTLGDVEAELCRRKWADFVRSGWHVLEPETPLLWNWHLDAIGEHLEAVAAGQIRRLLINIGPGLMKSLSVSVFWPAWMWASGRPWWRGLFGSYAADLAIRDSKRCRDLIESDWYQQNFTWMDPANPSRGRWALEEDENRKSYFQNTKKGLRMALSVGGKGTGFRGHAVVVDDPISAEEAYQKIKRERAIRWWDKTMSSRFVDQRVSVRVIMMQRLHQEDLSGHVLEMGGYEHLCLPTEFDPARRCFTYINRKNEDGTTERVQFFVDPRTEKGELLHKELFNEQVVAEAKKDMGSYGYAGQHDQNPHPPEGEIFKRIWFRYWRKAGDRVREGSTAAQLPESFEEILQSWDMAFKDTKDSAYVVCTIWGRKGADRYLLARPVRDKLDLPATIKAVQRVSEEWPQAYKKLVEDKANGPGVIASLKGKLGGFVEFHPGQDSKEARAHAVTPQMESGNVYFPEAAEWLQDYEEELLGFPRWKYKDQVDTTTQALMYWLSNSSWQSLYE